MISGLPLQPLWHVVVPACRRLVLGVGVMASLSAPVTQAQTADNVNEYQLKAVFLYNFSKFIVWPDNAFPDGASEFGICVLGNNPFGDALSALAHRTYQAHPITIHFPQNAAEARSCQILYVDDIAGSPKWQEVLRALADAPLLTVSNGTGSAQFGTAISFVQRDGKIRWVLNLNSTRKAQLKVSAKLVEIATDVIGDAAR